MTLPTGISLQRLSPERAQGLVSFYNTLSAASKRTFRPLNEQTTIEACLSIAEDNVSVPYTKYDLIAWDGQYIVGWSFIWNLDQAEPVFGLAVADAWHGKRIGSALIQYVMDWARTEALPKVTLTVVQDNTVAWTLYEKHGFVRCGEFTHDDGLDYYRMEWKRD